jgi:flagellar basal-body rod modification protein FlgD
MNISPLLKATDTTSGSSAAGGATGSTSGTTASATSDAADRFLKLLVAQLQNQDPLNPLDNAEVTTQLAQISTVTGINQLNDTMSALGAAMSVTQVMQAASLVGHDVVVSGNNVDIASGGATAEGGLELGSDADHVIVTVSDDAGNVVRTMDLGAQKAGDQFFTWDGKTDSGTAAPTGHYTFSATATANGKAVTFDTLMTVRVEGVVSTGSGAMLQLPGGTQIAFGDIKQIH